MEETKIEPPQLKMLSHAYQVGAPANPYGVTINLEMEWIHNKWVRPEGGEWQFDSTVTSPKKYVMTISSEKLEELLNEWKAGCIDYEEWLLDLKHKHEEWKLSRVPVKSFWQKVFRRTASTAE